MKIYIPTYKRPDRQITLQQLLDADIKCTLVLSKNDPTLNKYKRHCAGLAVANVETISAKRQWIMDFAETSKIVMLDDDLTFYARRKDGGFDKATPQKLRAMFEWIEYALDEFAHAGIVDKFMSQSTPRSYVFDRRYNAVLAYNLRKFPRPKPIFRVPVSEEHDFHLQLATRGYRPIVSTEWSKNTSYYAEGGCADERSAKSEERGHRMFAANWPGLVSVVPHKTNISGLAVRVKWSKAKDYEKV